MDSNGDLWSPDEGSRRFAIIECSRNADASHLSRLIELLHTDTQANCRHIVRALGRIGGPDAERELRGLIAVESGLILGDIARALAATGCAESLIVLDGLSTHELEWVRDSARWAIKHLKADKPSP